jgi:hypothetical protein
MDSVGSASFLDPELHHQDMFAVWLWVLIQRMKCFWFGRRWIEMWFSGLVALIYYREL